MSKTLFHLSLILLFAGCVEVRSRSESLDRNQKSDAPAAPAAPDAAALAAGISWEAVPAKPDHYRIALKFPVGVTAINRWVDGAQTEMVALSGLETGAVVDEVFAGGTKLRYLFNTPGGQQGLNVLVPKDLIVEGNVTVPTGGTLKFSRVFMNRGARLLTNGLDMTLEAETIFADGAFIETFPEGARAADGVFAHGRAGRPGGKVIIKAKSMTGKLDVILRGEGGGHGSSGAPIERARDGELTWTTLDSCVAPPAGQAGENGRQGNPGFNGGDGGAAGSLLVDLENDRGLELRYQVVPGAGGSAGSGGPGQPGGIGGLHKVYYPGRMCYHAFEINWKRGPDGAVGAQGIAGKNGKEGSTGTCLDRKTRNVCVF